MRVARKRILPPDKPWRITAGLSGVKVIEKPCRWRETDCLSSLSAGLRAAREQPDRFLNNLLFFKQSEGALPPGLPHAGAQRRVLHKLA